MSNYWKKKLEELEQSNSPSKSSKKETTSVTKSDYWGSKLTELEKAEDIAPVAKPKVETTTTKIVGVKSDKEEKGSFWDWLGNSAMSGLASFNKGLTGTADLLLGKPLQALGWENNPISEASEYYSDEYDIYKNKATTLAKQLGGDKNIAGMGNGYQIAGELLEGTVAAAPMAIEALMTGGGSLTDDLATAFTYRSGNLLAKAGLTAEKMTKNPAFWTSFAQTYSNDYEEAVKSGVDENVALYTSMLSSLINAGIEIGIDGASGIQGLPKKALKGDKSALMEWVQSSLEEGGEEILQGVVSRGINDLSNGADGYIEWDEDTKIRQNEVKVFDLEQMLKEGLMGTAVGGILGGGQIGVQSSVNAVQQAQANKLTADEQAVVDKVVETRITEEELAGKPVTASEKRAIEKQVRDELEKGRISIETIEEVLGGDSYKTYKDAVDSEDKQIWELDRQIKELESAQNTVGNNRKYDALTAQLEELKANSQRDALRQQLDDVMRGKVGGTRLAESYNEQARRKQPFAVDLSQYDGKTKEILQGIVDKEQVNNTNAAHDFWSYAARAVAGRGGHLTSTTTEEIYAMETEKHGAEWVEKHLKGKIPNAYRLADGTIAINVKSKAGRRFLLGHEITHDIEDAYRKGDLKSDDFDRFKDLMFAYERSITSDGAFEKRLAEIAEKYGGINEDAESELLADLVGEHLYSDTHFIEHLHTKDRNLFQRMWDKVKYLYKMATAGSQEARDLERIKREFERVYRESGKANSKASGDTKYSLGYHAGDLGKAELLHQQGYSRGTGHFGTGTYFVGDEAKISGHTYGARPHHAVEFDNYNLYKVRNDDDGYALHDQLKVIDGGISQEYYDRAVADEYSLYPYVNAFELAEKYEAEGNSWEEAEALAYQEIAEMRGIEYKSAEEYGKENDFTVDDEDFYFYYNDYLKETVDKATEEAQSDYAQFRDAYFKLWLRFGKDNTNKALQGVIAHQQKINPDGQRDYWREHAAKADSFATVFMKSLGYEGIDTRGTGLDNVEYGSVIYDLKGEDLAKKNAIGTAKYSLTDNTGKELSETDKTYADAVKNRDWETAEKLVVEAAEKAGYTRVVYHGTEARFTVFDTDEESTNRAEHAWMADYPDGTIFLAESEDVAGYYGDNVMPLLLDTTDIKVFEEPDMYAHRAMDDKYGYEVYNYPVIAVKGKDMTIYATLDNTAVKSALAAQYDDNGELIPLSQRFKHDNPDIRYSLSAETDTAYMDAVERGDTDTAQMMVDEAAKEAGYTIKAYHGTQAGGFTVFDKGRVGKGNDQYGAGFYFTTDKEGASHYGNRVVNAALDIKNPIRINATRETGRNLIDADITLTSEQAYEIVKRHPDIYDAEESPLGDYYDSYWENGAQDWMIEDLAEQYRDVGYLDSDLFRNYPNELHEALRDVTGYDGVEVTFENGEKFYVAWFDNQMKSTDPVTYDDNGDVIPLSERFNAESNDIRNSLSYEGETHRYRGDAPMSELALDVAPVQDSVQDSVQDIAPIADNAIPDNFAPATEEDVTAIAEESFAALEDADAPPEMEAPYYGESEPATAADPLADRDWVSVGDRKVKAFMYENPEVKPFFQAEAGAMLGDLYNTIKGERHYNDELYYATNGEKGWYGTKRFTSDDIAYLLDGGISYAQLEKGLNAIIEDNGAENNAVSKRIELAISDRLRNGYTDFMTGEQIPPNQEYIEWLNERQHNAEYAESIDSLMADAPISEEIAPIAPMAESQTVEDVMPIADAPIAYEAIRPKAEKEPRMARATPTEQARAQVLTEEPKAAKKKNGLWSKVKNDVLDKGMVFEDLSLKTGNRELQAKWNSIRYADGKAQKQIGESLKPIREAVEKTGKTQQFYEYLYHMHNVDRMTLAERFPDMENKPVFGDSVTARESRAIIAELVRKNPEFKQYAQDVYEYNENLRELLVEGGVISRETANLWEKMYPHYVPIRRDGDTGLNINVPLDTGRTGVNAPIKRATGGSRDILPLFDTMGQRTIQTYKAIAKNRFGVELKNTLGTTIESDALGLDEAIDSIDAQDGLLQEGKNGKNPTFTVFENGEKVTFEITEEMYDALKPTGDFLGKTIKPLNVASNIFRGLTTEYNPTFIFTNPIKDVQDVLINSQHPARTYAAIPKAIKEMATNGHWYQEYVSNGGEQNTYFDKQTNTFTKEKSALGKALGLPLKGISKANNFIEMMPRLAEYIVSREMKRSIDVSMLDAARVTTNFAAGGDLTKWANRNGATFLNASVQGAVQQVRNVREAKANGLKGVLTLAAKFGVAGLSAALLNGLLWKDDEEYEELSDYVKQNYYIVGKFGDGQFVRIPKGRTVAVIQDGLEQMQHLVTGDDEADLRAFGELLINNLAPNNPLENNIFAPIVQAWNNKTWYGEDLVPTRLQDLPANEQYDESTDSISRWLGEKLEGTMFEMSPYKINYLLNQYGGGVADTFLPMRTPEAERGDDSFAGNMIAPFKDKFTTDSVMNNQYVSDFYDTVDELAVNANSSKATDEDVLKYKYINSVNAEMGELYQMKREVQNSNVDDADKYATVRAIQQEIDSLAKKALNNYNDVYVMGNYALAGDRQYRWYEPSEDSDAEAGWQKLTDKQVAKQDKVTSGLGITPSEYWSNKEEYDFAYEYPEKYKFFEESGISYETYKNADEDEKRAYTWAYENPDKIPLAKAVAGDIFAYRKYTSELYDIKADKDENGKSISGSRKDKVLDYVNGLDIDYGMRIILFKSEYTADDTYNNDIIDYLNDRDDISYDEMVTILKELDFTVSSDGSISW